MYPELSVVIPIRSGGSPDIALDSLRLQNTQMEIILVWDEDRNANKARNRGAALAMAPYLLFCDDDICWQPEAIDRMMKCLKDNPEAVYVYGAYKIGDRVNCNREFDRNVLLRHNFISTMSIIRADYFTPFDPNILRLQDWDLWLTLLEFGYEGVYCGELVFTTAERDGITRNGQITYQQAETAVRQKHSRLFS